MTYNPTIVLLTGSELRHKYVAQQLARTAALIGIVSEVKSPAVPQISSLSAEEQGIIGQHFAERNCAEKRLLKTENEFPGINTFHVPSGTINSQAVVDWVQARKPDLVMLYGTGLIKQPLLGLYKDRMINLHLGLSPYYRGSGTNFWPLVNGEPECVGATIHLAVEKVDAGGILAQVRPVPEAQDRIHELGTKTIIAAVEILPALLTRYAAGEAVAVNQDLTQGRVYRKRDFTADAVRQAWKRLDAGLMQEYISNYGARCNRFPIRELTEVNA